MPREADLKRLALAADAAGAAHAQAVARFAVAAYGGKPSVAQLLTLERCAAAAFEGSPVFRARRLGRLLRFLDVAQRREAVDAA